MYLNMNFKLFKEFLFKFMGNNYLFFKVNFFKIDGDVICGLIVNIRRKYKGVDFGWGRFIKFLEIDSKILLFL